MKIGIGFQQMGREGCPFQVKGQADPKGRCGPSQETVRGMVGWVRRREEIPGVLLEKRGKVELNLMATGKPWLFFEKRKLGKFR